MINKYIHRPTFHEVKKPPIAIPKPMEMKIKKGDNYRQLLLVFDNGNIYLSYPILLPPLDLKFSC